MVARFFTKEGNWSGHRGANPELEGEEGKLSEGKCARQEIEKGPPSRRLGS